jgi:hypothetical protein
MEDLLWLMSQQSRVLQELRKDCQVKWDDEAAREINNRYLDPHATEDEQMILALNQQETALDNLQVHLVSMETFSQQVEENAELFAEQLTTIERDINSSFKFNDTFAHYNSEAKSVFPNVQRLIDQANTICGN